MDDIQLYSGDNTAPENTAVLADGCQEPSSTCSVLHETGDWWDEQKIHGIW